MGLMFQDRLPTTDIAVQHDGWLMLLSLLVAIGCAGLSLHMVRSSLSTSLGLQRAAQLCACIVLGFGIWAMHFIGMLAMHLPNAVTYDLKLTALSVIPSMLAAGLALKYLQAPRPAAGKIIGLALAISLLIAAMHYCGLAAMPLESRLHYSPLWFVTSFVFGALFIGLALAWPRPKISEELRPFRSIAYWLPALAIGLAIVITHYSSMIGAYTAHMATPTLEERRATLQADAQQMAILIAVLATAMGAMLALGNGVLRYKALWKQVALSNARFRAMVDTAHDGVITIDRHGLVQSFNPAAEKLFGFLSAEVVGRNVHMLMPAPIAEQHDGFLAKHLASGSLQIGVNGREVLGQRKDGRLIPLKLSIGRADTPEGPLFVGFVVDISESKRVDKELRIAASVFEHTCEGMAIIDAHYNITDINPAFALLMESQRANCLQRPFEELFETRAVTAPDMRNIWKSVAQQQLWQGEMALARKDGSRWVQRLSISAVLDEKKRIHHYIAVVSNVSGPIQHVIPNLSPAVLSLPLPDRRWLQEKLRAAVITATRRQSLLVLIAIELLPEPAGSIHPNGVSHEQALELQAQRIYSYLRASDALAQLDSRQLLILLSELDSPQAIEHAVQRIRIALSQPLLGQGLDFHLARAMGMARFPLDGLNFDSLVQRAVSAYQPLPDPAAHIEAHTPST